MQLTEVPPPDWDAGVSSPFVGRPFADAARASGHRVLFINNGGAPRALALVRTSPVLLMRSWTRTAHVYVSRGDAGFVRALVAALGARGIAQARLEDAVDGLPCEALEQAGVTPIVSYRIAHSLLDGDRELFRRLMPRRRMALRRGRREGITVSEIRNTADLQQYCLLAGRPERPGGPYDGGVMPAELIRAVFGGQTGWEHAVFLLARRGDQPVAGAIFLASPSRMTLFHTVTTSEPELAVSAWDPDLADFQGPTAVTWHAMRLARARGIPRFDLGTVTPVTRRNDPRFPVDYFKRSFGGQLEPVYHGEVTLSRLKQAFRGMLPAWNTAEHDERDLWRPTATVPALSSLDSRKSA